MINYILLVIAVACTIFNVWLTLSERQGYDKGLEDGIRMTNEVLEEDKDNTCEGCYGEFFGDCDGCAKNIDCPGR